MNLMSLARATVIQTCLVCAGKSSHRCHKTMLQLGVNYCVL